MMPADRAGLRTAVKTLTRPKPRTKTTQIAPQCFIDSFERLSDREMAVIKGYARCKMCAVKGTAGSSDGDELINEAIARTLDGRRMWDRRIDMVTYLRGCMRSISDEWRKKSASNSELIDEHTVASKVQAEVEASQIIQKLRGFLKGDSVAMSVIETMLEERSPAEAQKHLKIEANVYNAARKRISRSMIHIIDSKRGAGHE